MNIIVEIVIYDTKTNISKVNILLISLLLFLALNIMHASMKNIMLGRIKSNMTDIFSG